MRQEVQGSSVADIAAQEALRPADDGSPLEWEAMADEVLAAFAKRAGKMARAAADDYYEQLLYAVQDYLRENVRFNIASRIDGAERQALGDRQRCRALRDERSYLLGLLREGSRDMPNAARVEWKNRVLALLAEIKESA